MRNVKDNRTTRMVKKYGSALLIALFFLFPPSNCLAQDVVDKMVATVSNGARTTLITYSDLLWQLALEPGTPVTRPNSEELNRALQLIINQRLIVQEAEKLPPIAPTDKEVDDALADLINRFPSREEFYQRVKAVGLSADQLREIIRQRVAIDKYLDFRFRSFTVVTPQEVSDYYRDVYVPRLQKQSPGQLVPKLEEVRDQLERTLIESKIESETDAFLDSAHENAEIVILNPV